MQVAGLINLAGNWSKPPSEKGSEKKTAFSVHEEPIAFTGNVEIASKSDQGEQQETDVRDRGAIPAAHRRRQSEFRKV